MREFKVALSFLTRLPVRVQPPADGADVAKSVVFFPLVGLVVAAFQAAVYALAVSVLPNDISAVLCVVAGVLVTGAFHHDGLADVADAYGGGWTPEQRRTILKDSRLGTYGVVALVLVLLLEVYAVGHLSSWEAFVGLMMAHMVSRLAAVAGGILGHRHFTSGDGEASAGREAFPGLGGLIGRHVSARRLWVVVVYVSILWVGFLAADGWVSPSSVGDVSRYFYLGVYAGLGVVTIVAETAGLLHLAKRKVSTINGDLLGAIQQITFVSLLVGWVIL